jgi:hypothetical protein
MLRAICQAIILRNIGYILFISITYRGIAELTLTKRKHLLYLRLNLLVITAWLESLTLS